MASTYAPTKANHPYSTHNLLTRGLDDGQPLMLTVPECAARLRVSVAAIRSLIEAGELRTLRVGHGRRIKRVLASELERYVYDLARQQS